MHKVFRRCQLRNRAIVPRRASQFARQCQALLKIKVRAGVLLHELALINLREFCEVRSDRIVHC